MPASAGDFPATALLSIGFSEVRLDDLQNTETYPMRAAEPCGFLIISADLNGDGNADEVRVLQNLERGIAYVAAAITTPTKLDTYVLKSVPLAEVPYLAIDVTSPDPNLAKGIKGAGIAIFDLRTGLGEAYFFDGEEFSITAPVDRRVVQR